MLVNKIKENLKKFRDSFMGMEGESYGAAAVDNGAEVIELKPNDFVPNGMIFTQYHKRVMALFGTNEKIITSEFTEDEWNSYFEATVEPDALEMGIEDTRKLFTPKDAQNNKIVYEASNLACASFKTRIELQAMVDRGALTPNEWRATFNRAPLPGGDQPIRRLDTQVVNLAHKLLDKGAEVNDVLALLGGEKEWQGL